MSTAAQACWSALHSEKRGAKQAWLRASRHEFYRSFIRGATQNRSANLVLRRDS